MRRSLVQNLVPGVTMIFVVRSYLKEVVFDGTSNDVFVNVLIHTRKSCSANFVPNVFMKSNVIMVDIMGNCPL
jgi:hypothetical protein